MRERQVGEVMIVMGDLQVGVALEGCHTGQQIAVTQKHSFGRPCCATGVGESVDVIVGWLDLIQVHLDILSLCHQLLIVDQFQANFVDFLLKLLS